MLIELSDVAVLAKQVQHHALLLTSQSISNGTAGGTESEGGLPYSWLRTIALHFCGIELPIEQETDEGSEASWAQLVHQSDIFVADRERAILRLEDVSKVSQLAMYPPLAAKRRLFFIDRCARLNLHATNSLLKLLEEPLVPCLFVLTAGRTAEVLPTIVSRCFRLQAKIEGVPQALLAPPLEDSDWQQLSVALRAALHGTPSVLGNSMWNAGKPSAGLSAKHVLSAKRVHELIGFSDRLSKQYKADVLQGALTHLLAQAWQGPEAANGNARAQARFILSDLNEWRRHKPFNLSSAHWLARILLKGVVG